MTSLSSRADAGRPGIAGCVHYAHLSARTLASIVGRVRAVTRRSSHTTLAVLLRQLNPALRGWSAYFRYGVSKATFGYVHQYTWHLVVRWIRKQRNRTKWPSPCAATFAGGGPPRAG
jgi:RNA-directed DNA polymerase